MLDMGCQGMPRIAKDYQGLPRIVRQGLPPVLRIDSTVRDLVDVVVFPEEKLSRIVRQGDPLPGYLCG